MRVLRQCLFYISLGIMFMAHLCRFVLLRVFGPREHVHGVRVILVRSNRVVLLRHWFAPHVWTLPGGGVKRGETIKEAAIREVYEETGYAVTSFAGEVGTYRGKLGPNDNVTVLCTEDFTGGLKFLPTAEIMERRLFDLHDLPKNTSPANRRRIETYRAGIRNERGAW